MTLLRGDDPADVLACAQRLAAGGLVAFATETVYGLGARADDDTAVAGIFAAKGRPMDHPLIVHVAGPAEAAAFSTSLAGPAQRLIDAFWPGPVTMIVPRRTGMATAAAGGQASIGLRCPAHPVAQALLRQAAALGMPGVAAPSANRFGRISPTRAAHVQDEFGPSLWVLDGGDCALGIESTIVDCTTGRPVLLRPGTLTRNQVEAALGERLLAPDAHAPRAPGTLEAHYAPRARLRLVESASLAPALAEHAAELNSRNMLAVYSRQPISSLPGGAAPVFWHAMPADPLAVAHQLFAVLRDLDARGVQQIWVERPPSEPGWDGVLDRLRRAAAS